MSRTSKTRSLDRGAALAASLPLEGVRRLHIWRGASGRRYIHGVFSLLDCPEVEQAAYVLVRRSADGRREALRIDRTADVAPSLNLAEIRRHAALLGANEVHVHGLAQSEAARATLMLDLRAGQFGTLAAQSDLARPSASCAG